MIVSEFKLICLCLLKDELYNKTYANNQYSYIHIHVLEKIFHFSKIFPFLRSAN